MKFITSSLHRIAVKKLVLKYHPDKKSNVDMDQSKAEAQFVTIKKGSAHE